MNNQRIERERTMLTVQLGLGDSKRKVRQIEKEEWMDT